MYKSANCSMIQELWLIKTIAVTTVDIDCIIIFKRRDKPRDLCGVVGQIKLSYFALELL